MRRLALLVIGAMLVPPTSFAAGPACTQGLVPAALASGLPQDQSIWVELCAPPGAHVVHVLSAGATYGHIHWDFPYQPERYSYVRALNAAGVATLNIDRLGIGKSSHPPSALVTLESNAFVIHQLISGLRAGRLGSISFTPFRRVVTVGNSWGSVVSVAEAAWYGDVDGVIVTGAHKNGNDAELSKFGSEARPAVLDPRFEGKTYDPGYLTMPDSARCRVFWSDRDRDCDGPVATLDNATKETITGGEGVGAVAWVRTGELGPEAQQAPDTTAVTAPMLIVAGQYDLVECGEGTDCSSADSLLQTEAEYYPNAASVEGYVLPGAGHVINLASNAADWFAAAADWTKRHFPSTGSGRKARPVAGIVDARVAISVVNKDDSGHCQPDGLPYTVRGELVAPRGPLMGGSLDAVTLYVHGGGSRKDYWHMKSLPEYDYAAAMARAGHASVVLDSLGYGGSDRPDGFAVCLPAISDIIHQIVGKLRSGDYSIEHPLDPVRFERVALAGHSAAGFVIQPEAYLFGDIDALIVTGYTDNGSNPTTAAGRAFPQSLVPYGVDCSQGGERKAEPEGPGGYAYSLKHAYRDMFFDAEERVIEAFAATLERDPCGFIRSGGEVIALNQALVSTIDVPVLVVNGEHDVMTSTEIQAARYTGSEDVAGVTLAGTGHMHALERTHEEFRRVMSGWLKARGF